MRTALLVFAVTVIAFVTGLGVRAALASPNHGGTAGGTMTHKHLFFHSRSAEYQLLDLGAKGPSIGDVYADNRVLYNGKEQRVGSIYEVCTIVDTANQPGETAHKSQCTETLQLAGGTMTVEGIRPLNAQERPDTADMMVVTGGTRVFEGIMGEVHFSTIHGGAENLRIDYFYD